ncbi:MAG: hypothetical protein CM1200mP28_03150 [Deltaproteobacteria bacterium]|nr:MAG: hypothetical protein CM1200mP28_03150 [Deltaproteobacteria bacterium]
MILEQLSRIIMLLKMLENCLSLYQIIAMARGTHRADPKQDLAVIRIEHLPAAMNILFFQVQETLLLARKFGIG